MSVLPLSDNISLKNNKTVTRTRYTDTLSEIVWERLKNVCVCVRVCACACMRVCVCVSVYQKKCVYAHKHTFFFLMNRNFRWTALETWIFTNTDQLNPSFLNSIRFLIYISINSSLIINKLKYNFTRI